MNGQQFTIFCNTHKEAVLELCEVNGYPTGKLINPEGEIDEMEAAKIAFLFTAIWCEDWTRQTTHIRIASIEDELQVLGWEPEETPAV